MQERIDLRVEVDPGDILTGKLCLKGRGGGGRWMRGMIREPEFGRPRTQKNGDGVFQGSKRPVRCPRLQENSGWVISLLVGFEI